MIGVPCSGKTTFTRAAAELLDAVRVNRDQIKAELCGSVVAFDTIIDADCYRLVTLSQQLVRERADTAPAAGSSVVLDVNHDRRPARDRVRAMAERRGTDCVFVWVRAPAHLAIERCVTRWDAPLHPTWSTPTTKPQPRASHITSPSSNRRPARITSPSTADGLSTSN